MLATATAARAQVQTPLAKRYFEQMRPGQLEPNELELAVLERLAEREPAIGVAIGKLHVLRREFTGVGSFTTFLCDSSAPRRHVGLDALITVPGVRYGLGAVLFMKGEQPDCLELCSHGNEKWDGVFDGFSIGDDTTVKQEREKGTSKCMACEREFPETIFTQQIAHWMKSLGADSPAPLCPSCAEERARMAGPLQTYIDRWRADFDLPRTDLDMYIFKYHSDALEELDRRASGVLGGVEKARRRAENTLLAWRSFSDPKVKRLLESGPRAFYRAASERALTRHRDTIRLNRCPKCDALCRTPVARQCPRCFHRWAVE